MKHLGDFIFAVLFTLAMTACASTGNTEAENEQEASGTAGPVIINNEVLNQ